MGTESIWVVEATDVEGDSMIGVDFGWFETKKEAQGCCNALARRNRKRYFEDFDLIMQRNEARLRNNNGEHSDVIATGDLTYGGLLAPLEYVPEYEEWLYRETYAPIEIERG